MVIVIVIAGGMRRENGLVWTVCLAAERGEGGRLTDSATRMYLICAGGKRELCVSTSNLFASYAKVVPEEAKV